MREKPLRCDDCGRFVAIDDFGNGAVRRLVTPDSDYSAETWETLCRHCAPPTDAELEARGQLLAFPDA